MMVKKQADTIRAVERYYGVQFKDMKLKQCHAYPVSAARSMVMYLLRDFCEMKIKDISTMFDITERGVQYRLEQLKKDLKPKKRIFIDYCEIIRGLNQKYNVC